MSWARRCARGLAARPQLRLRGAASARRATWRRAALRSCVRPARRSPPRTAGPAARAAARDS
eukprot:2108956-Alexandrium_andersonii.AAC.1